MQYKVPQNIDLEDKIVGPFTMKQFLYLFVGGFILYGWWNYSSSYVSPSPMAIFLPLAIPLGFICFCLAVVKVNDRPFEVFVLNLFKFVFSPKQRKWTSGYVPESVILMDPLEAKDNKDEHLKTESDLDSLAKSLEEQTEELKVQTASMQAAKPAPANKPQNINLSVSDVGSAATKQQEAQSIAKPQISPANSGQPTAPAQKKGFFSFLK